jgi:hypothetical protein
VSRVDLDAVKASCMRSFGCCGKGLNDIQDVIFRYLLAGSFGDAFYN